MKDLSIENYRALLKEIKEYLDKWRGSPWMGSLKTVKLTLFPKLIVFNTILTKIPIIISKFKKLILKAI